MRDSRKNPTGFAKKRSAAQQAYEASANDDYRVFSKEVGDKIAGQTSKECDINITFLEKIESGWEICQKMKDKLPQVYGKARQPEFMNTKQGKYDSARAYWSMISDRVEEVGIEIQEENEVLVASLMG